jgi:hypothetical protein
MGTEDGAGRTKRVSLAEHAKDAESNQSFLVLVLNQNIYSFSLRTLRHCEIISCVLISRCLIAVRDKSCNELLDYFKRPSPAHRDRALGAEFLTAEAANTVPVAYLGRCLPAFDRFLRTVGLTDAALVAQAIVDHRLGRKSVLHRAARPFRKLPFNVSLRRKMKMPYPDV